MTRASGFEAVSPIVVCRVGEAGGSLPLAAALACAGSDPDRAGLLVSLGGDRPPRPTLICSAGARRLEERLAAHVPGATLASRGAICHLALPADEEGLAGAASVLPLARDALGVVHVPGRLLHAALGPGGGRPRGAVLRADLSHDRALAALAVRHLLDLGLAVAVAKSPLSWVAGKRALLGALPAGAPGGLPSRTVALLAARRGR